MSGVDPEALEFALGKIEDGFVFERFALDFVSKIQGYQFIPAGGLHDRGIDGFEHAFTTDSVARTIYQLSIEKDSIGKIRDTAEKLKKNKIPYDRLFYVTNRRVERKDALVDEVYSKHKIGLTVWDIDWFRSHVNDSTQTVYAYHTFIESHLHEFTQPGKSYEVADLEGDPRLFVFLRQLWDEYRDNVPLEQLLADALILFSLEGTDPQKGVLRSKTEMLERIAGHVRFDPNSLFPLVDQRLKSLSTKPRKINHHVKEDAYCLHYDMRIEIQDRNLRDAALYEEFVTSTESRLRGYLPEGSDTNSAFKLIEASLHQIFRQQGLEFAAFVLHGDAAESIEKQLPDIVAQVVDESAFKAESRATVKSALLMAIRSIVYDGTPEQTEFLQRLSRTYMMLFLLQCDPKLATYFATMMARLKIYVCTSILIPALSEYFLDQRNQRYSNLLRGAIGAGAKVIVNETIIAELAAHFRMIKARFEDAYAEAEDVYSDEAAILYVPEIMIRAYFYSKLRGHVRTFPEFLEHFVSVRMANPEQELIDWLRAQFQITYASDASLQVQIDAAELDALVKTLAPHKSVQQKAKSDAALVLAIYALRAKGNEAATAGIFGFDTWWLSTDTTTEKAVRSTFKDKYKVSCYIRADFLYHFISLAPSRSAIDQTFSEIFPSLVGVSVSYHLPAEVVELAHEFVKEHAKKNPARLRSILRDLSDRMKSDPRQASRGSLEHYFDEERRKLEAGT